MGGALERYEYEALIDFDTKKAFIDEQVYPLVMDALHRLTDRFNARDFELCEHLLSGPQPAFVTFNDLGHFRCARCNLELMLAQQGTEEDSRCDFCGTVPPDGIWPIAYPQGHTIVSGGICDRCKKVGAFDAETQRGAGR